MSAMSDLSSTTRPVRPPAIRGPARPAARFPFPAPTRLAIPASDWEALVATRANAVVVGHEDAAPGAALEKLHEAARGCFLGMAVEDDCGHEQYGASHGGAGGVSCEPGANRLGDRVRDVGGPGTGEKPDDCVHLRLVLVP